MWILLALFFSAFGEEVPPPTDPWGATSERTAPEEREEREEREEPEEPGAREGRGAREAREEREEEEPNSAELTGGPPPADPSAVPPTHRLWYRNALFLRINPLGAQDILDLGWRYQLVKKPGVLYRDSYLFLGAAVNASPSFLRAGAKLEVMPISILRLEAKYQFLSYLGAFDNVSSFPSSASDYSDRAIGDAAAGYVTTGGVLELGGRLQLKLGPIAVRDTLSFAYYHVDLRDGDAWFYEQYWDRLARDGGWLTQNDLDVLGVVGKTRIGLRYTFSDTLEGDGSRADQANHRIGPLFAYEFHDRKPGARFNHPTLFVVAQWWAQHPFRSGQQQPVALPLIAVGLTFDGDLIGPKPPR